MFREAIHRITAYTPGEQPPPGQRLIKLNTNENPYPPSPRVVAAIAELVNGRAEGLAPGSQEFTFRPGALKTGRHYS